MAKESQSPNSGQESHSSGTTEDIARRPLLLGKSDPDRILMFTAKTLDLLGSMGVKPCWCADQTIFFTRFLKNSLMHIQGITFQPLPNSAP